MLRQTRRKRHLISPPSHKKGLFLEGDFLELLSANSGHFQSFVYLGKYKKSGIFSIFGQIGKKQFFFHGGTKNEILLENRQSENKNLKITLRIILASNIFFNNNRCSIDKNLYSFEKRTSKG